MKRPKAKRKAAQRTPAGRAAGRPSENGAPAARKRSAPASADAGALGESVAALRQMVERLGAAVAEIPRATDFEPLAEHLYSFATTAPRLLESLEAVPRAVEPIQAAVRALTEVSETLQYVHQSFTESILRLPRAEDYEPLAEPLREFAKVSPALTESLADVMRAVAPLQSVVRSIRGQASAAPAPDVTGAKAGLAGADRRVIEEVAAQIEAARDDIVGALNTLPRDPQYGRVASQLRELATVSPSLMEWLGEVRSLSMPLGESVQGLERTAQTLTLGHQRLVALLRIPPGSRGT